MLPQHRRHYLLLRRFVVELSVHTLLLNVLPP
jgi:hypothetical protein